MLVCKLHYKDVVLNFVYINYIYLLLTLMYRLNSYKWKLLI